MYTITLPSATFYGERYGLHFEKGEATTENEWLANRLKDNGLNVRGGKSAAKAAEAPKKTVEEKPKAKKEIDCECHSEVCKAECCDDPNCEDKLRAEYTALTGKKAHHFTGKEKLLEMIKEAQAAE